MLANEDSSEGFHTQLEQMTAQLVVLERRAKTLAELNRLLSQGSDPLALAQRAVDLVMRATGASGTYVYRWDAESERLVMRVATTGRVASYLGKIKLRLGEGINGWAALMRQTVVIDDAITEDPRFVGLPGIEEEEFRSMLAVPIAVPGGDLLGVFSLYSEQSSRFRKHDVELATEVGVLLANGLTQAEMLDDLRRQSSAARFLLDVSPQATTSLQQCVDELARSVRMQVDADLCVVEMAERSPTRSHCSPGLAFSENVEASVVSAGRRVRSRADLSELVDQMGGRLTKISSSFGAQFPEGAVTCYRTRQFPESAAGLLEALGAQAGVLLSSLRNDSSPTPLAGRLTVAAGQRLPHEILRDLGWKGGASCPILVRLRSAKHMSHLAAEQLSNAMFEVSSLTEGTLVVPSPPLVTVLVPYSPEVLRQFEASLRQVIRHSRLDVAVGIGPPARDADDLLSALDSAESALAWADLLDDPVPVVRHVDVEHLRRLPRVALDIGDELREVAGRFDAVSRYDHRHGTNLAATLDCYLATRCSAVETAKTLFIHRNTLRQRLTRIEEIIGRPVEDFGDGAVASLAARMTFSGDALLSRSPENNGDRAGEKSPTGHAEA
ncbi:GAF domain-containing protein [Rhodococcus sp. ABRD24]|uniref:helix-turn-helix domain-containing protein n=1 Tax=Rhodococcus sp. ABRD24 TaxID=2507582 RepID=UPI00103A5313|nr:GAF domain-containing protein [Rhodococcus sp. ABRD24]QBJ97195.1 GAF domain-containing protein [Rhodococcus sp. ABRD24]